MPKTLARHVAARAERVFGHGSMLVPGPGGDVADATELLYPCATYPIESTGDRR
jgi:hypothetical protein